MIIQSNLQDNDINYLLVHRKTKSFIKLSFTANKSYNTVNLIFQNEAKSAGNAKEETEKFHP